MGSLCVPLSTIIAIWCLLLGAESKTHWGDAEVLKELKQGLEQASVIPGSCVSSWDFTLDPCDNLFADKFTCGFRCDVVVSGLSRVTELALDQAGYVGSLTFTWNLPFLQTLDLSKNNFSAQIPDSFSNLTRLRRLSLSSNSFSGEIPPSLGTLPSLEELYLDSNNLRGTIPQGFHNLKRLELQSNNLNTHLPNFDTFTNLKYLDFSDNSIAGELPASLPVSLVQISIRNNNLNGVLSSESFRNLKRLQVVDFSSNRMSGLIPSVFFELPSLQQLTLSFNEFTKVEAPYKGVESRSRLIAVDLSNNRLEGFLPSFMAMMPKLSSLSLENNEFTGRIATQLAEKTVSPKTGVTPLERLLLTPVKGLYLFGGVGTGKTMLMDLFFEQLPSNWRKKRIHFHDFMLNVHSMLQKHKGLSDPLDRVAGEISDDAILLCLDEFMVTDVADALILNRLFRHLFNKGIILVATSNRAPDNLYEGGLQRDLFLPFIAALKERCVVHEIGSSVDYRKMTSGEQGFYLVGRDLSGFLKQKFQQLIGEGTATPQEVELVMGRKLQVPLGANGCAYFPFEELCDRPLGAADYFGLFKKFHTLVLEGIPIFGLHNKAAAHRFVTLVDVIYENKARLLCTADGTPQDLFEKILTISEAKSMAPRTSSRSRKNDDSNICVDNELGFTKDRTISRLTEINSREYLEHHAAMLSEKKERMDQNPHEA